MALITVSGGMGCGADKVARFVADKTKLALYDDQKLQIEAIKLGLRSQELKGFDEKAPGFFESLRGYNPELYIDLMESVIYELSRTGNGLSLGTEASCFSGTSGARFMFLSSPRKSIASNRSWRPTG